MSFLKAKTKVIGLKQPHGIRVVIPFRAVSKMTIQWVPTVKLSLGFREITGLPHPMNDVLIAS